MKCIRGEDLDWKYVDMQNMCIGQRLVSSDDYETHPIS
jgi:hypothetical protein